MAGNNNSNNNKGIKAVGGEVKEGGEGAAVGSVVRHLEDEVLDSHIVMLWLASFIVFGGKRGRLAHASSGVLVYDTRTELRKRVHDFYKSPQRSQQTPAAKMPM